MGSFGKPNPLTYAEVLPYILLDEHFIFSDLRGFVTNDGRIGGNLGTGYRYLDTSLGGWYGASLWYDIDNTTTKLFQQMGLSAEAVFPRFELRSNFYLPVTGRETILSDQVSNQHYVGNQLQYSRNTQYGNSLTGWDVEAGTPISLPFMRDQDRLRIFGGWYHFLGNRESDINGFKCRVEAVVNNSINTQVAFTTDRQFGSQVSVGVALELPWGGKHPTAGWKRETPSPFRFVERNYNVIVERFTSQADNVVASDPTTGKPYFIEHVSGTGTANSNGSFENPFATINQAQGTGADIVFVHSDANITSSVMVDAGTRVLGDGVSHVLNVAGYGTTVLPSLTTVGNRPIISVPTGPAVTLASNTEFSGFQFKNLGGDGVVGQQLSNVTLSNLSFLNVTGDAIHLQSLNGTAALHDLDLNTIGGRGLVIEGGSPSLKIDATTIKNTTGDALVLSGLTSADVVINGLSIDGSVNSGLVMEGLTGAVAIDGASILNTRVDALRVHGGSAAISLLGTTTLASGFGRGLVLSQNESTIKIHDLSVSGAGPGAAVTVMNTVDGVTIDSLTINRTAGPGLIADTAASLTVSAGNVTTVGAAALDIKDSNIAATLTSVNVDHGVFGIQVVNSTGSLLVQGGAAANSGGTIQNTTTGVILNKAGTVQLQRMQFLANQTAIQSTGTGYLSLFGLNVSGTSGYAVDSLNDKSLLIDSSTFTTSGALGGGTVRIGSDKLDNYQVSLTNNIITDANGTAVLVENMGVSAGSSLTLAVRHNLITSMRDGTTALSVNWNGPLGIEVSGNTFALNGAQMTGLSLVSTSASDALSASLINNTLVLAGSSSTGFNVNAAATSTVTVGGNTLTFNGNNSTGVVFSGAGQASLWLSSNNLTANASGTTGFLFPTVAAGSTVTIDSNRLNFADGSAVIDRGFVFTTLGNTVALQGTTDNILTGVVQPLLIPSGKTTGGFYINSVLQQP